MGIADSILGAAMGIVVGEVIKAVGDVLIEPSAGQTIYQLYSSQRNQLNILGLIPGGMIGTSLFPSLRASIQRKDLPSS